MAYIAPNSTVEFFSNIGLNDNYDDTLYFASTSAKDTYFTGLTKLATANAMSYNREQRGFIRVELPMSTLISASYMRFKNTSFENKWFYAFVKNVEYINNNCTQVNFKLDVMMTWMGAFTLNQCFIERQHVLNDAIGANIATEGFELGNYVCENSEMYSMGDNVVVLYKAYNDDKGDVRPSAVQQGTYLPITQYAYFLDSTNIGLLETMLDTIVADNRADEIITLKLVPERWVTNGSAVPSFDTSVGKPYSQIGGGTYVPRNNKLFTYPFKYLQVENGEGQSTVYKYEYFTALPPNNSNANMTFRIRGSANTPECNVMCTPVSYKGESECFDESISMSSFPTVSWNVDGYRAYIAQRDSTIQGNIVANMLTNAATGAVAGFVTGGAGGAVAGAALGEVKGLIGSSGTQTLLADTLNEMRSAHLPERMPNQNRGMPQSNLMVQSGNKKFYFRKMCITENYARMIDDFFDMYGYAIRQHAVPNMNARPNWTFVKTKGCSVDGAIPADDASAIENIFNNGVRFWKNHTNIGNYSLSNTPT